MAAEAAVAGATALLAAAVAGKGRGWSSHSPRSAVSRCRRGTCADRAQLGGLLVLKIQLFDHEILLGNCCSFPTTCIINRPFCIYCVT